MILEINYYAQTHDLLDDLGWFSIRVQRIENHTLSLTQLTWNIFSHLDENINGWEKHRLLRRVEEFCAVQERWRERELGDDEGFVRSVGGLGEAQWRRCTRAAPLLVFFFPLSLFSDQSLFCGHRRCNPKAFFFPNFLVFSWDFDFWFFFSCFGSFWCLCFWLFFLGAQERWLPWLDNPSSATHNSLLRFFMWGTCRGSVARRSLSSFVSRLVRWWTPRSMLGRTKTKRSLNL